MIRRPRSSLAAALGLGLTLVAGASPMGAADPVTIPPAPAPATSQGGLPGSAMDVLTSLGSSLLDGGLGRTLDTAVAAATSNPCSGTGGLKKSTNGSVTVLLLGSDYRKKPYIGERTDTVITLNIARNGRVSMAAIPRDTTRIPLGRGRTSGARRINALYIGYKRRGIGPGRIDCSALDKLRRDVARTLDTYIPYYALIRMDEFQVLLDHIGGIRMNIRKTLIDYHYRARHRKIWVPASSDYQLNGGGLCGPKPTKCRSALRYARSRHGTEGGTSNSDYRRIRRQQQIVFSTIRRVLSRGNGANLMDLLSASKGRIYSNLPKNASGALELYSVAKGASFRTRDGVVFGPQRWATYTGKYTFRLRLHDVRQWVHNHFKP